MCPEIPQSDSFRLSYQRMFSRCHLFKVHPPDCLPKGDAPCTGGEVDSCAPSSLLKECYPAATRTRHIPLTASPPRGGGAIPLNRKISQRHSSGVHYSLRRQNIPESTSRGYRMPRTCISQRSGTTVPSHRSAGKRSYTSSSVK